jgi:hypothetical protein
MDVILRIMRVKLEAEQTCTTQFANVKLVIIVVVDLQMKFLVRMGPIRRPELRSARNVQKDFAL